MKFEIISASGGYRARIIDGAGEIIFISPAVYESKAHAKSVIALVSNAAPSAEIEDNS